jgi:hypothetical protein
VKCPFCKGEVEIASGFEDDDPFGRVQCPHPRCSRDVVLAMVPLEEAALLDAMTARDAAWRAGRSHQSYLVTSFIVCGFAVCGVMGAASSLPDALLLPIAALSLAGMAITPFAIDRFIGTRQWLKALPQRNVKLVARSTGYRA